MAEVHPFQGLHYNQRQIRKLDNVICSPYDVISPEMQEELYCRSGLNFVRIEYTRVPAGVNSKYAAAAATLEQWLEQGVLIKDEEPAIYLHEHHFSCQRKSYTRHGIIARVRLEEPGKANIKPHEGTLSQPKSDRLSLLWACQANTSPIFVLFEDKDREIASLISGRKGKSLLNARRGDESHEIRAITEPEKVTRLCQLFSNKTLYIADGHHRYESALTYQREKLSYSPNSSADEPFNFVMMTLVDFADPGLVILPPHRLVRGLSKTALTNFRDEIGALFDVQELPFRQSDTWKKADSLTADVEKTSLVLFGLDREKILILTLRDPVAASKMMPYFHSELYKSLEVSIIDHVILEELLGLVGDREQTLAYCYDRSDTVNRVLSGEFQLAFLIKPVKAEIVKAIADSGDRMPKKSTYFYPKVPAGLMMYRLV